MMMPCLTSRVARDVDRRALVVGAVAGNVDDALRALKAAFGEEIAAEFQRAGNRGAAGAVGRMGGKLLGHPLGVGTTGDHRPRHDDMLRGRTCPFDIGDGDLAIGAVGDRLQHMVVRQRRGIAVDAGFRVRPATSTATRRRPAPVRCRPARRRGNLRATRASAPARRRPRRDVLQRQKQTCRKGKRKSPADKAKSPTLSRALHSHLAESVLTVPPWEAGKQSKPQLRGLRFSGS